MIKTPPHAPPVCDPSPAGVDAAVETVGELDVHLRELEQALALLESVQQRFRRGRIALAPYLRSATDACANLEASDISGGEDPQRILETVEALERFMRIWEKSRGYWTSGLRSASRDSVSAS